MSGVRLLDLLSIGDNKSSKEIIDTFSKNEEPFPKISFVRNSKIQSLSPSKKLTWTSGGRKPQFDTDIDYAFELLKKEDQNINVYSHLQGIMDKILLERPENPLKSFELYSQILKRSYIPRDSYFEPIYVDSIYRDDCRRNLQMYKCALKIQSEKQKRYNKNNTSTKKSGVFDSEDKKTFDCNDIEVRVQNLWEVNYMFNKAGCGLPTNEIALLSLAMNTMARSNKFKNIRFWGKIFGTQQTYFILECEWTDEELHRKILKRKSNPKSSSLHVKEKLNNSVTSNYETRQTNLSKLDFSSNKNKKERKSKETSPQKSSTPKIKTINNDFTVVTNESIVSNDSWISTNKNGNCKTKLESSSQKIPDEEFGTGANKNVYFVSNDLNIKFIELDSVRSQHIAEARKIKRYFTGNLFEPINSYPKFEGLEIDYLRAQIARISASTQICPLGYYLIDKREMALAKELDNKPLVSSDSTKIIHVDLIRNENFKPIPNDHLIRSNNWVHKNPRIQTDKIANDFRVSHQPITNEELISNEDEEYVSYMEDSTNHTKELFGNLKNDITIDNTPAWKGSLCSPFDLRNSCTMMKSHIWPGAFAVAYKLETDYVYIGWAQKNDSIEYCSNFIGELRLGSSANEDILVYQEHTEGQKTFNLKKNVFHIRKYRKSYKGSEKMLTNYTYD